MIYLYFGPVLCRSPVYFPACDNALFGIFEIVFNCWGCPTGQGIRNEARESPSRLAFKIKQTFSLAMEMTIKIASNLWHTEIERREKRRDNEKMARRSSARRGHFILMHLPFHSIPFWPVLELDHLEKRQKGNPLRKLFFRIN